MCADSSWLPYYKFQSASVKWWVATNVETLDFDKEMNIYRARGLLSKARTVPGDGGMRGEGSCGNLMNTKRDQEE